MLDREKIDFLFSDAVMPHRSDVEMSHAVRQKWHGLPIRLASGYSGEVVEGAAEEFHTLRRPLARSFFVEALSKKGGAPAAGAAAARTLPV